VAATATAATNDWYGKLFVYLQDVVCKFLRRLKDVKVDLQLLNIDAKDLPDHLERDTFARIEVCTFSIQDLRNSHLEATMVVCSAYAIFVPTEAWLCRFDESNISTGI
jgi:hypothetical protein